MGGFPTFCEDPDDLLQLPEVRSALEASGMTIQYWDGTPASLGEWANVPITDRPLVIVEADYPKHLVQSNLKNFLLESISISEIFSKFHAQVVKELPKEHWDSLFQIHLTERPHRAPNETALLIGRAFYGVDPIFLSFGDGWIQLLRKVAETGRSLPTKIAEAVLQDAKLPPWLTAEDAENMICNPAVAKLKLVEIASAIPGFIAAGTTLRAGRRIVTENHRTLSYSGTFDWQSKWNCACASPSGVLSFSLDYGRACADGDVSDEERTGVNREFFTWLKTNFGYVMTSPNAAILRLPTLVRNLDEEAASVPLLFVVVDALGLESWFAIKEIWRERMGFSKVTERSAFAILPTLTVLSRRSIFEGKVPSQFGPGEHSQDMERRLWKEKFGDDGAYFTPADTVKIDHAFARHTRRVAIVDTTWDSIGHSIYPQADSVVEAAKRWAATTPLADILGEALDHGYKVVITADHGQIAAVGAGRINVGELAEERSKRVVIFQNDLLLGAFQSKGISDFQPYGLPQTSRILFAKDLICFDIMGVHSVSHGGATIEEAVVPVIEVSR